MNDFQRMLDCFSAISGIYFVVRVDVGGSKYIFLSNEENMARMRDCDLPELIRTQDFFEFDRDGQLASY